MPGPLGTLGPTVDPNWAWNTPAWNSQTNTGDTIGTNLGAPGQGSMLVEPAALSGYIARTLDPDVSAAGASSTLTLTSNTAYLFNLQVMDPVSTTGVVISGKNAGTTTHAVAVLYNAVTGTQVAVTADLVAAAFGTAAAKIPWAAVTPIASGYYTVLLVATSSVSPTLNAIPLTISEAQTLLTGTHPIPFVLGTTPRFATGGTGLTGLTATPAGVPAALTAANVVSLTATASFVGLY